MNAEETIIALVKEVREAKAAYLKQNKAMHGNGTGVFNGRLAPKNSRLYKAWKKAEEDLLKAVYAVKF